MSFLDKLRENFGLEVNEVKELAEKQFEVAIKYQQAPP